MKRLNVSIPVSKAVAVIASWVFFDWKVAIVLLLMVIEIRINLKKP